MAGEGRPVGGALRGATSGFDGALGGGGAGDGPAPGGAAGHGRGACVRGSCRRRRRRRSRRWPSPRWRGAGGRGRGRRCGRCRSGVGRCGRRGRTGSTATKRCGRVVICGTGPTPTGRCGWRPSCVPTRGPRCWPRSRPIGVGSSPPPGPTVGGSPTRPTTPMPWWRWRRPRPVAPGEGTDGGGHVLVDHAALVRGHAEEGESCEIPGVGPIPVASARRLADDGVLKLLVTKGVDIVAVAHGGRTIPAHVRTALEAEMPSASSPAATSGIDSRSTTSSPSPRVVPPPSTTWPGCATSTTTSRPTRAGAWPGVPERGPGTHRRSRGRARRGIRGAKAAGPPKRIGDLGRPAAGRIRAASAAAGTTSVLPGAPRWTAGSRVGGGRRR